MPPFRIIFRGAMDYAATLLPAPLAAALLRYFADAMSFAACHATLRAC